MKDKYEEKIKPYLAEIKEALINGESHKSIYTRFGITKTTLYAYRAKYAELDELFDEKNLRNWRQAHGAAVEPDKKPPAKKPKTKRKTLENPNDLIPALKKLAEDETILLMKESTETTYDHAGNIKERKTKTVELKFDTAEKRQASDHTIESESLFENLAEMSADIAKVSNSCDNNSEFLNQSIANLRIEIQSKDKKVQGLHEQIKGMRQENEKRVKQDAKTIKKLEKRLNQIERNQEQEDIDSLKKVFEELGAE